MKIFDSSIIKDLDQFTIENEPIQSIDLMERAAGRVSRYIIDHFAKETIFTVFAGAGNNGGDGLAIARQLIESGFQVNICLLDVFSNLSDECATNLKRLEAISSVERIKKADQLPDLEGHVALDCIFGSGLSRPVEGFAKEVIHHMNASDCEVLAVDIASGLYANQPNDAESDVIVEPTLTLSLQLPKRAFFMPENAPFVGQWQVIDIGLEGEFISSTPTTYHLSTDEDIRALHWPRHKFDHKGHYGHAMIMAGSKGTMGAALLAVRACLRSGTGLVTAHVPEVGYSIMQSGAPEAMTSVSNEMDLIGDIPPLEKATAIGFGPGAGTDRSVLATLKELIITAEVPLVIDADGLNLLATKKKLLEQLPEGSILTPHPKEFERLAGKAMNHYDRLEKLQEFCKDFQVVTVLKGAHTAVCDQHGTIHFNNSGTPALASGGSGDVLTGLLTGLSAMGYSALEAARLGVWLHGVAGEIVVEEQGNEETLVAGDLIDAFKGAFARL